MPRIIRASKPWINWSDRCRAWFHNMQEGEKSSAKQSASKNQLYQGFYDLFWHGLLMVDYLIFQKTQNAKI